jgi:CBS domain-containing protein
MSPTRHIPIDGAGPAVRDVMLRDPRTVGPDTPVAEVRETFANPSVKVLLVADGERFLGTLGPADLPAEGGGTIAELLHADARRLKPEDAVEDALRIVEETGSVRIPVVDAEGRLEGLVCFNRSRNAFCATP